MTALVDRYFYWLLKKAGVSEELSGYSSLCWVLYDTPFLPVLEMDANRWEDGLRYRNQYADIFDVSADDLNEMLGGCTLMELLLSLAEKMKFEMADSDFEADTPKWFEELLENLGLDIYTNNCIIMHEYAFNEIEQILERFNLRQFKSNGEGSPFPLRAWAFDQRKTELIAQMNNYLADRYDIL